MPRMKQQIRGVIFDMDGVVVNNHHFHFKAWMEFAHKYNFQLDESIYRTDFNGKTNSDLFKNIFGDISELQKENYSIEKEANYRKLYKDEMKPHIGLVNFLNHLKENHFKIALGTSAPKPNVDFTLDNLKLREYFDVIIDGSDVTKGKPDPEVYLKCSEKLFLSPEQCLVFEDSIAGLMSGRNAGCQIVGVATSHKREELAPIVNFIIDDFSDFKKIIDACF